MSHIWITGCRGFIGRHLAKYLAAQGHRVIGLGHGAWPEQDARSWGVSRWLNGDVQPSNFKQLMADGAPDFIFHLAGGSSVGAAIASPREDFARTVATTTELLDWIRTEVPAVRLVAISSAAVYGAGHPEKIAEGSVLVPFSPYGYHKLMMEQLCQSYAATYGTQVVVARLFSVYGSFLQKQLLWDLCTKLNVTTATVELGGTGKELRDWTDIRDVVRALDLLKDTASNQVPIVNVGTGQATSVLEIATLLKEAWGSDVDIAFSGKSRAGDPFSLVADSSQLQNYGFEWNVPVQTGIRDYVEWYRQQAKVSR